MTIPAKTFHKHIIVNSMDWAKQHIYDAPDGSLFLADIHETTRGRQGRTWEFDQEQIIITLLLKPDLHQKTIEEELRYLIMALSVGVAHALTPYNVGLKWPNDFVVNGKKLGGMLLESIWQNNNIEGIIAGIAINGNNISPQQLNAISLKEIAKTEVDLSKIQNDILASLDFWYSQFKLQAFDDIFQAWKTTQIMLGKQIQIHTKNGDLLVGIAQNVLKNGDLVFLQRGHAASQTIPFCIIERISSP